MGVDPNLIAWNRVVLLHGPPNAGKDHAVQGPGAAARYTISGHVSHRGARRGERSQPLQPLVRRQQARVRLFQKIQDLLDDEGCWFSC